jgi:uncharacterized damage-inducible protein DinB
MPATPLRDKLLDLFEYTHDMNVAYLDALERTPGADADACQQMAHVIIAINKWFSRLGWMADDHSLWEELSIPRMRRLNAEVYSVARQQISDPAFDVHRRVRYTLSNGEVGTNDMFELLFTLVNHATHHRAHAARALRAAGTPPPRSDFFHYRMLPPDAV